ncbi:hypothetical protein EJ04DRAFT_545160 [Polyplosphaeria fusca]|uniref:Spindle pole body component n=1 Tax=Polyplosphaeria fusca TaxID=682080 RepID=A0A9P4QV43_9PLEO|nr:hypothetical protein EJ04DRAFT_545160 [Polyplosphaeria fusca]
MDDDGLVDNVFSSDGLWNSSRFFQDPTQYESCLFESIVLDVPSIKFHHPYAAKEPLDREIQLPDLDTFEFGTLPELEPIDEPSPSTTTLISEPEDDIWKVAFDLGPAKKDTVFFTWEGFENAAHVQRRTIYITECGPAVFDAALAKDDKKIASGRVAKADVLLDCLFNLGLGRSSILFFFDHKLKSFMPSLSDGRFPGLTLTSAQSLINRFILTGNTFLFLRSFMERTFSSATSLPAGVAMATSISSVLSTFEEHIGGRRSATRSLLQLQDLFSKPHKILLHLARIVDAVKHSKTNEHLSSIVHHRVLDIEEGDKDLRQLSMEMLRRVSKPSLEVISEWTGLRAEQQAAPIEKRVGFIVVEDSEVTSDPPEYGYNADMMPRFISPEDGDTIFEIGNSLRFLKYHHPEHPLAGSGNFDVDAPALEWKFGWADIEALTVKAKCYGENVQRAILDMGNQSFIQNSAHDGPGEITDTADEDNSQDRYGDYILESAALFDQPPQTRFDKLPDEIKDLILRMLSDPRITTQEEEQQHTFSPPISTTSILSFRPLLTAQARLVNATTLRLFFRSHKLQMHISLQRQYHLFGDGVFSSRLSSALFDPERETAERRKGTVRSGVQMGLQVGARDTWPPASSELRLALMGVLSESFYSSALYHATLAKTSAVEQDVGQKNENELPGQLNFAVRQLTEPEMEKCMDPDSLYALDFLRLQYVPPSPLNLVITATALDKYDYIFRFLLRLLRMLFVVSHLPRMYADKESRSFRLEATHFVTTLATYTFQTGIASHWDTFSTFLSTIQSRLAAEDAAHELGTRVADGLSALRKAHEQCLDGILFSLLLRRRQKQVMALVEEIFEHILLFAKMQRADVEGRESVQELYAKLRGKIKVFISVCRGLTGKRGYGKGKGSSEENTMERLVVGLEMNGYYTT